MFEMGELECRGWIISGTNDGNEHPLVMRNVIFRQSVLRFGKRQRVSLCGGCEPGNGAAHQSTSLRRQQEAIGATVQGKNEKTELNCVCSSSYRGESPMGPRLRRRPRMNWEGVVQDKAGASKKRRGGGQGAMPTSCLGKWHASCITSMLSCKTCSILHPL